MVVIELTDGSRVVQMGLFARAAATFSHDSVTVATEFRSIPNLRPNVVNQRDPSTAPTVG
jgi:hypothetical protein